MSLQVLPLAGTWPTCLEGPHFRDGGLKYLPKAEMGFVFCLAQILSSE